MSRILLISANSDLAKACARVYAQNGFDLILTSRDLQRTEQLANDIETRFGKKADCLFLDLEDINSHKAFFDVLIASGDIDGCISFTGYLGDQIKSQSSTEELIKITTSNYLGIANVLEMLASHFEQKREGFIVGVSSVAGDRGRKNNYHYGAAKAAFTTFLSGMRNRLTESNVHVLTVKPGFMDTNMTQGLDLPPLLTAKPQDAANVIFKAQQKKRNVVYVKGIWFFIMLIIKHLPESIFKKTNL